MKETLGNEAAGHANILIITAKAEEDAAQMKQKYEVEADDKEEKLEMTTMKITDRKTEAEATNDNLNARHAQVKKAKSKIQEEINEITANIDQAQVINAAMKRKAETSNTTNTEMKGKVDRLSFDLDVLSNLKRKQEMSPDV